MFLPLCLTLQPWPPSHISPHQPFQCSGGASCKGPMGQRIGLEDNNVVM